MELSKFDFDIVYRSGKQNSVTDALSRAYVANIYESTLRQLHESLCHPGGTMAYFNQHGRTFRFFATKLEVSILANR